MNIVDIFRGKIIDVGPQLVHHRGDRRPKTRSSALIELLAAARHQGDRRAPARWRCSAARGVLERCDGTGQERGGMKIYYDKDADLEPLQGQEGRRHRLRQPGACARAQPARQRRRRARRPARATARRGRRPRRPGLRGASTPPTAAREADVVMMLVPDELGGEIYEREIAPGLTRRASTSPSGTASTSTSRRSCRPPT